MCRDPVSLHIFFGKKCKKPLFVPEQTRRSALRPPPCVFWEGFYTFRGRKCVERCSEKPSGGCFTLFLEV